MSNPYKILKTIVEHLKIGLVVIDNENRIIIFNHLAEEMLQQKQEERLGSSIFSCHPQESDPIVEKLIKDIKTRSIDYYEGWVNYRGRMLYEYILPIWDSDGNYLGMIEELHDATEKVELMKRLDEWVDIHISGIDNRQPREPERVE